MKQARYTGGSGTGVDVHVICEDGLGRYVQVDQGEPLPAYADGIPIPSEVHAELAERDGWEQAAADGGPTLETLRQRATELDITGRSSMSKDELVAAIAQAEAAAVTPTPDPTPDPADDTEDDQ